MSPDRPHDSPKAETPRPDAPKADQPKDQPKTDAPKADAPKADAPREDPPLVQPDVSKQPFSARAYGIIAATGLAIAIATAVLLAYSPPEGGAGAGALTFLLLVICGLATAAFLYGAVSGSYAVVERKAPLTLRLGGPVAVAALVVAGGFYFVQHSQDGTFDVTVRIYDRSRKPIANAQVTLDVGDLDLNQSTNANGRAEFRAVPRKYKGRRTDVLIRAPGFEATHKLVALQPLLDLALDRNELPPRP